MYKLTFYSLARALLLYGENGYSIGRKMGYRRRMTVIYNSSSEPLDCLDEGYRGQERLRNLEQSLPPLGHAVAGAVIRLNHQKRLDLLIRATAIIRNGGHAAEVLLVGDGPERDELQALADQLHVPLYLPGAVYTAKELELVYQRLSVTVVPSYAGLTVLQSLKHGRPVITHNNIDEQVPEFEAIRPDETGDLYSFGDLADLAATVAKWLDAQAEEPDEIARLCRESINEKWNAASQARLISDEIDYGVTNRDSTNRRRLRGPEKSST